MTQSKNDLLQHLWDDSIQKLPRPQLERLLKQVGFDFSLRGMDDEKVRKLLFGFLSQLEEPLLRDFAPVVEETAHV